jgi:hypothetical protein
MITIPNYKLDDNPDGNTYENPDKNRDANPK